MRYKDMEYTAEYRNLKYPRIDIRTGELVLILPYGMNAEEILGKNEEKIRKKLEEIRRIKHSAERGLNPDEVFLIGKRYKIVRNCGKRPGIYAKEAVINICGAGKERIREIIKDFLREKIERKLEAYSKITGLKPNKIFIREQITKWGSCSSKGNLNFNLRLVFVPPAFFDYIVLHELLHLRYMNHGKDFKRELKTIYKKKLPDDRAMLKYWFRSEFMMKVLFE